MFDKVKQMMELKKQADALKKMLADEIVEVEAGGMKIVMTAEQKVKTLELGDDPNEKTLLEMFNKASEEAQKVAAKKMQEQMGGMSGLADLLKGS